MAPHLDDDFLFCILFTSYINLFHLKALGSIGNDTLPESFKKDSLINRNNIENTLTNETIYLETLEVKNLIAIKCVSFFQNQDKVSNIFIRKI